MSCLTYCQPLKGSFLDYSLPRIKGQAVEFSIQAIEHMGAEFQALLDEVATGRVAPVRLDDGEEFLGVPFVNLRVQSVVDKFLLPHPALLHDGFADGRGDAGKGVFDDA